MSRTAWSARPDRGSRRSGRIPRQGLAERAPQPFAPQPCAPRPCAPRPGAARRGAAAQAKGRETSSRTVISAADSTRDGAAISAGTCSAPEAIDAVTPLASNHARATLVISAPCGLEPFAHAFRGEVRQGDVAHTVGSDESVGGAHLIGDRHGLVIEMQVVQVDQIGLQALQRLRQCGLHGRGLQSPPVRLRPHLRGDDQLIAVPALGHPLAQDRLRLAAGVPLDAGRVAVGRVDEVASRSDVGVEHGEGPGRDGRCDI